MKLLHLIRSLNPDGGGPMEGIRQLIPHLDQLGVETTVACLDPPGSPWLDEMPAQVKALGPVIGNYGYRPGLPAVIANLAFGHDAVIVHGLWQYHALAAWRALAKSNTPYFVFPHGMLDPWFKRTYPLKHFKKLCYWPLADYRLLRDARSVLFTADKERLLARESFSYYKAHEHVVAFGTAAPTGDPSRQRQAFLDHWPELKDRRVLLFLSRIHPKKGLDLLIEAFATVKCWDSRLHLVIAGPDSTGWRRILEQRAVELGIADHLTWTGMLRGDLKWGAFHAAELFCLPSHQENFGIAIAEALACGLPVAIADPVNISSDVSAAGAGFIHADTKEGTEQALVQFLQLTEEDRRRMGLLGRQLFDQKFASAQAAQALVDHIKCAC